MPAARTAVNGPANGGKLEVKTARIRQDNAVAVAQGNIGLRRRQDPKLRYLGVAQIDVTGGLVLKDLTLANSFPPSGSAVLTAELGCING
jgi:hypothetical protein